MNLTTSLTICLLGCGAVLCAHRIYRIARNSSQARLYNLQRSDEAQDLGQAYESTDWKQSQRLLESCSDTLGRAGFILPTQRRTALLCRLVVFIVMPLIGTAFASLISAQLLSLLIGSSIGFYIGLSSWMIFLRVREKDLEREILFRTPLILESLILLVESGLGILPAIAEITTTGKAQREGTNPMIQLLELVYRLSLNGIPLSRSLAMVADASPNRLVRHVFLHLDISALEGGELVPSLRSLSDHTHAQWRLGVESRVKRLENLVVFPVFTAVMGLFLLTASVPLIPLLDFLDHLPAKGAGKILGQASESEGSAK